MESDRFAVLESDRFAVLESDRFAVLESVRFAVLESGPLARPLESGGCAALEGSLRDPLSTLVLL